VPSLVLLSEPSDTYKPVDQVDTVRENLHEPCNNVKCLLDKTPLLKLSDFPKSARHSGIEKTFGAVQEARKVFGNRGVFGPNASSAVDTLSAADKLSSADRLPAGTRVACFRMRLVFDTPPVHIARTF
jgi:hypothetical protein